jgi:hypothetical protein
MPSPALQCPEWADDFTERKSSAFESVARRVTAAAFHDARVAIPDSQAPRKWHEELFKAVAPMEYYAGNYRQDDVSRPCLGQQIGVRSASGSVHPGAHFRDVIYGETWCNPWPWIPTPIRTLYCAG